MCMMMGITHGMYDVYGMEKKGVWYSCEMHVMMHKVRGILYTNCCVSACIPYENLKWVLLKYKEIVASEEVVVKCR